MKSDYHAAKEKAERESLLGGGSGVGGNVSEPSLGVF